MSDFLTEIPANCLFNKKQTGCGATELAIRNSIPTIIAMPYVALVKNKTIYRKDDISVLGVYEGIQEQDIIDYAKSHSPLKIAVTYDSLPRTIRALESAGFMDDKLTHIILTDHALRYGLDGKSAYEIAQKYGYEGTEQEYAEGPVIAKDKANKAADSADKAAERAKKSASNADQQAARAKSLADHPPKIVDVGGLKYWAFWDEATKGYVTSEYRADDGTIVQQVEGSAVSLDVKGGTMYVCGELTSLTIASVENSTKPSIIRFTSGATATQFSFPEDFNITGWSKPEENERYTICILFGAGNMTYDE